jgi:hypothetical protein
MALQAAAISLAYLTGSCRSASEASAVSAWSHVRRNEGKASSLNSAGGIISMVNSSVLSVSIKAVKAPRKAAGRRASIKVTIVVRPAASHARPAGGRNSSDQRGSRPVRVRHLARSGSLSRAMQRAVASWTAPVDADPARAAGRGGILPSGMLTCGKTGRSGRNCPGAAALSRVSAGVISRGAGLAGRGAEGAIPGKPVWAKAPAQTKTNIRVRRFIASFWVGTGPSVLRSRMPKAVSIHG